MANNICMFDLETFSKHPTAAIASIGACVGNIENGIIGEFYQNVSITEGKSLGLKIDQDTMDWWKSNPKEVLMALMTDIKPVKESLESFFDFYSKYKCTEIWAWGTSFDAPIIVSAMHASGAKKEPWKYWEMKCARTFCSEFGVKPERIKGEHHNALSDAKSQMVALLELKKLLKQLTE